MEIPRTIAVVPLKHHTVSSFDEIRKISLDFAIKGIETISQLPRGETKIPLRFIYMSSSGSVREDEGGKKPFYLGEYTLMRVRHPIFCFSPIVYVCLLHLSDLTDNITKQGEAESRILQFARKSGGKVQACVARPGVITDKERDGMYKKIRVSMAALMGIPRVEVDIAAMALLEVGLRDGGLEMEVFENEDLVRIGRVVGGGDGK